MFLQAMKLKDNRYGTKQQRLEPIQLKYSPKEPRQHTPEGLAKIGLFNSTQFHRKQSIEKRKLSSQVEGKRPQSSVQRIPRTAFLKNTFAAQFVFFCENGNNGALVRRILQGRGWFAEQQTSFKQCKFYLETIKQGIQLFYSQLKESLHKSFRTSS